VVETTLLAPSDRPSNCSTSLKKVKTLSNAGERVFDSAMENLVVSVGNDERGEPVIGREDNRVSCVFR
jgi:hypothetical protein